MVFVFIIYTVIYRSSVSFVINNDKINPTSLVVKVNEDLITPVGSGAKSYKIDLNPGTHNLLVSGPTIETLNTEFTTSILENKELIIDNLVVKSAQDISSDLYNVESLSGFGVFSPRLYGDNTWIAFVVSDGIGNGSIIVGRYNSQITAWEIVSDGTDIDFTSPKLQTAPKELSRYISDVL